MAVPFTHLHLHTQYSLLDGAIKHNPLFERVKALGQEAIAMTDHGNLFGAVEFYEKALANKVKPTDKVSVDFRRNPSGWHDFLPKAASRALRIFAICAAAHSLP